MAVSLTATKGYYKKGKTILKKIIAALAAVFGLLAASGCSFTGGSGVTSAVGTYNYENMHFVQFDPPREGQTEAVIETTKGTIKAVLYEEYAPNTVKNFVNRVNEGYYDGKEIYAVIDKAFFMSGACNDQYNQGVTDDGQLVANEYTPDLWTFKGAICSYSGTAGFADSRFFIINNKAPTEEEVTQLKSMKNKDGVQLMPDEVIDAFVENDGVVHIAGCYTVFAQTIEGFDVIEAICEVPVDEKSGKPTEELKINRITLTEYSSAE